MDRPLFHVLPPAPPHICKMDWQRQCQPKRNDPPAGAGESCPQSEHQQCAGQQHQQNIKGRPLASERQPQALGQHHGKCEIDGATGSEQARQRVTHPNGPLSSTTFMLSAPAKLTQSR